nr:UDP-N-acetylmuramoyl-tripeptide--D-alanyl-D-alanine ligase [bacterium]
VLGVANVHQATLDIGKLARDHYKGNVIGITGSAGKTTTVTMLAHVLSVFGKVGQTARSANLPIGIAWNMAVMPQDADYWVLEMAVGRMSQNSQMIRPDIAIMTNIAPAHLEYHHSVENIALKKSQIFEKMPPGGLAVICRDIPQYDLIRGQAELYGAQIVSYGEHPASDIRLTHYEENTAHVQLGEHPLLITLQARGKHMAMNALSVLAVAQHYKLDMPAVVRALGNFQPVAGRGKIKDIQIGKKNIRIIDETYNANPLSMKAALNAFAVSSCPPQHRVAILGDMLELGANSEKYHLELLPFLEAVKARITVLCGDQMHALFCLFNKSKAQNTVYWCKNIDELIHFFNENTSLLLDGDEFLIKSSHGVELHRLIAFLESIGSSRT